jgi:hypothetical protein
MSKFATLFALITTMVTLVACGFHPVYGVNKHTNIGVEQHLAQIHIGNIKDRFYRDERPNSPLYTLSIQNLRERITELDITKDAESTRGQLRTTARLVLTDQDGAILLERNVSSTASFNVLASEFTNRVSEQNTRENTLGDLARQIEQHIALYFKKAQ